MATLINAECINCAACEPECPNTAIYQGGVTWVDLAGASHPAISDELFYIVPEKCTECVGFYDQEACAKVCPVDACIPDPAIPEAESLLLARARIIHPDKAIPDDAPSRFKAGGGAASPAVTPAPAAPAPIAAASASTAVASSEDGPTLSIPPPDDWEIPIRCFRCTGEYEVPFRYFKAGTVFFCPHCNGSLVPSLSMTRAVGEALERFYGHWEKEFDSLYDKRRRELEAFEGQQQRAMAQFRDQVRDLAFREKAAGTPIKRKGFFSF